MTLKPKTETEPAPLSDAALDAAAGGYELQPVFITSYSVSGAGGDSHSISGEPPAAALKKGR